MGKLRAVWLYVAAVTAGGIVAAVALVPQIGVGIGDDFGEFWLLVGLVALGEFFPIKTNVDGNEGELTVSTIFTFALVLRFGAGPAVFAQMLVSLIADFRAGKPLWKILFNGTQISLALCASGAVLGALTSGPLFGGVPNFSTGDLPGILVAVGVFFVTNNALCRIGIALHLQARVIPFLLNDLGYHAWVNCILVVLSPIVVVVAERSLVLIPVLTIPMAIIWIVATMYAERDYKAYQALHDDLTGLPNRTLFYDRLDRALLDAKRKSMHVGVMLIDLDRFKEVNDSLGHHIGDLLLQKVGPRVMECLREIDTFARLGGDEFTVLLPAITGREDAVRVADRLLEALEAPFVLDEVSTGITIDVEASIGIAMYPEHGVDVDTLMQRADVAMYVAKEGKTGREVYADENDRNSPKKLALLGELRRALDRSELELFYQPKVSLDSGNIVGVEALLRWRHPRLGMVSPEEFIVAAEQTGLIRSLTKFSLETALHQWQLWHRQGIEMNVAVNLSRRNLLGPDFVEDVMSILNTTRVPPERLLLEITESSILADPARASEVCIRLNELGIGLSLDDFGAGYSSLGYLKRLPVTEIKIDKSFVLGMVADDNDEVIVRSTIDLARNLGLRVVAEGVETVAAWSHLQGLGCDVAQGFFLARPMPGNALRDWLMDFSARVPGLAVDPAAADRPAEALETA